MATDIIARGMAAQALKQSGGGGTTVSGTNDGTNWTSITIGNETYGIPSGSSGSGGSGSGETLKIIEINGMFVNSEVFQLGITKTKLDYFFNLLSQGMGITVNEDNIQTIWANANDYEKMTAFHSLTYFALFMKYGMQTVCYVNATSISVDNQTVVTALNLVMVDTNGVSTTTTNESDLSTSTITITTIGGGNGGSSADSSAYYEIKTSNMAFYEENGTLVEDHTTNNFTITFSEGAFEACLQEKINPYLTQMGMPTISTINEFVALMNQICTETETSNSNKAYNLFLMISGYARMFVNSGLTEVFYDLFWLYGANNTTRIQLFDNDGDTIDQPFGISATWTLSQYGTSGGSSASESYYKIELTDYNVADNIEEKLILMIEPSDFNAVLTEINTQMGTSLSTPQDLITFYDSVKGNNAYYGGCCLLFATMCELCIRNDTNAVFVDYDLSAYNKITTAIGSPIPTVKSGSMVVISALSPDNNTSITFTSSSTLTITEQDNQDL